MQSYENKKKALVNLEQNTGQELSYTRFLKDMQKDLTKMHNQLALFNIKPGDTYQYRFYKLAVLDHRSLRFEAWGNKHTRWLRFEDAILFNYVTDKESFDRFYELYIQNNTIVKSKEKILEWLEAYEGRIAFEEDYVEILKEREAKKKLENKPDLKV